MSEKMMQNTRSREFLAFRKNPRAVYEYDEFSHTLVKDAPCMTHLRRVTC